MLQNQVANAGKAKQKFESRFYPRPEVRFGVDLQAKSANEVERWIKIVKRVYSVYCF
jgi:hypothetical protein